MELCLVISVSADGTFDVFRQLQPIDQWARDCVMKLNYDWTPWPRKEGNLLW